MRSANWRHQYQTAIKISLFWTSFWKMTKMVALKSWRHWKSEWRIPKATQRIMKYLKILFVAHERERESLKYNYLSNIAKIKLNCAWKENNFDPTPANKWIKYRLALASGVWVAGNNVKENTILLTVVYFQFSFALNDVGRYKIGGYFEMVQ